MEPRISQRCAGSTVLFLSYTTRGVCLPQATTLLWRRADLIVQHARRARWRSSSARHDDAGSATEVMSSPIYIPRQVYPRGSYYDVLLTHPPPYDTAHHTRQSVTASKKNMAPEPKAPEPQATEPSVATYKPAADTGREKSPQERARIVFGSRLAGPMERANRLAEIRQRSTRIAGVLVPPKPEEPDNCCMSGCVNCVWDRFRDEMEAWAQASTQASQRLRVQECGVSAVPSSQHGEGVSMDDDGGGSDANWGPEGLTAGTNDWDDGLYKSVPVGIREFMKQEKRLKLKHQREGTVGG